MFVTGRRRRLEARGGNPARAMVASVRPMSVVSNQELVLVTGKGGVGKTTLTAALARAAHRSGRRVLVTEVAPDVHNPSPVLGYFGKAQYREEEPVLIEPRLFGVRLTPPIGHRQFLRAALRVRLLVDTAMKSAALTRFLLAAPTFPEIGLIYQLVELLRSKKFDQIFVDLPATGHAIALASLPKVVHRILPTGLIGDAIGEGLAIMGDPKRTAAVVITLPEAMPVTESVELIDAFSKCSIRVASAVLNKLPPDPFNHDERKSLTELLERRRGTGEPRLLGTRELRRLERAQNAQRSFHEVLPPDVARFEVPLFEGLDHRRVAEEMEATLSRPVRPSWGPR